MKRVHIFILVLSLAPFAMTAGCHSHGHCDSGTSGTTNSTAPAISTNTRCPIDSRPVDTAYTAVYDGKTVGFCCHDCMDKWSHSGSQDQARYWSDCCR
jgi:YHS domain-containing protein